MKLRLTKIKSLKNKEFKENLIEGHQLEGILLNPAITVGCCVSIDRCKVNGVQKHGHFTSSEVVEIKENIFYTKNSIWKFEII